MLCASRIYLNTVIFNSIYYPYIRILTIYVCVYGTLRAVTNTYLFLQYSIMHFYKYSNTFDNTLFYIYVSLLYICVRYASRFALLLTYFAIFSLCFSISTVI